MSEVVDLRDRLLAPVTALGEVDGRTEPIEFVRDAAFIDLGTQTRPPGGDPKRVGGDRARRCEGSGADGVGELGQA
jgi:hypothetical protein